jgi:hypothetical protein
MGKSGRMGPKSGIMNKRKGEKEDSWFDMERVFPG